MAPASTPNTIPPPQVGSIDTQPAPTLPPPPTQATVAPTTLISPSDLACLARTPVAVRAGQLVWPATYGEFVGSDADRFAEWGVGGAVVMTWPASAKPEDLKALKTAGKVPLLLATDEEGGDVQRFALYGPLPSQRTVAETMKPEEAKKMITDHAVFMKAVGIDIVFGPVVDIAPSSRELGADNSNADNSNDNSNDDNSNDDNSDDSQAAVGDGVLGDRTFGDEAVLVDAFALAYVEGWKAAGILPVIKHFPGHGSASGDTHNGAATTPILAKLRGRDLLPYADLVTTGAGVMVGHLNVPELTDEEDVPASLSKAAITSLLREELGFGDALVFTDSLNMDAITDRFTMAEGAVKAIVAGADVALFTKTEATPDVIAGIVAAVEAGEITDERFNDAVLRVLAAKQVSACDLAPSAG